MFCTSRQMQHEQWYKKKNKKGDFISQLWRIIVPCINPHISMYTSSNPLQGYSSYFFPVSSHLLLVEICPKMHALTSNLNNYHILDIASPLAIFCPFRQNRHSQRGHFLHPNWFASSLAIFRHFASLDISVLVCQSVFCTFVIIFDMNHYINHYEGALATTMGHRKLFKWIRVFTVNQKVYFALFKLLLCFLN